MRDIEVEIKELRSLMEKALILRGISKEDAAFIIDDLIEAECEGKKSHGLAKFFRLDRDIKNIEGKPRVIKQSGNYIKIDGQKELGVFAAKYAIELGLDIAKENGSAIVGLTNASRYVRLKPFGEMIAKKGYVGIILNSGGGTPAVVPFNGVSPIFGTNPMCFAFPSKDEPYIFDFATSKKTWGEIRLADLQNRPLDEETFLDKDGNYTTDSSKANAILPFGGAKGYALCYAIEILTGALVGAKMGNKAKDQYDLGFLFIILSPEMFGDKETFMANVDELAKEIRASKPYSSDAPVRIPGEQSANIAKQVAETGKLKIAEDIYEKLKEMSMREGYVFY